MKNKIRIARAILDISQEELANRVGVSRQTINAMEANKYAPSTILALKIARECNQTVEELFQLDPDD